MRKAGFFAMLLGAAGLALLSAGSATAADHGSHEGGHAGMMTSSGDAAQHGEIRLSQPDCLLQARPLMADQEIHFPAMPYWEGAVRFEGVCDGKAVLGKGYIELTGYGGKLPLP